MLVFSFWESLSQTPNRVLPLEPARGLLFPDARFVSIPLQRQNTYTDFRMSSQMGVWYLCGKNSFGQSAQGD